MRLFEEGEAPIPLRLISSQAFSTGVVYLIYAPAESTPVGTYDDAKAHLPQAGGKDVRQPRPGTESLVGLAEHEEGEVPEEIG
jgi:hypothetical protein